MSPGVILVSPPDTDCDFIAEGPSHVLTVAIPKAHVEDFMQDSGARVEVRREETFREPRLARQLIDLWHTLTDDAPASRLFADQVMRHVLDTLARRTESHDHAHPRSHVTPANAFRLTRSVVCATSWKAASRTIWM